MKCWMKLLGLIWLVGFALPLTSEEAPGSDRFFRPGDRAAQGELEAALLAAPNPQSLRALHDRFSSEPHVTGTPGDLRMIEKLVRSFEEMGLTATKQELEVYVGLPVEAAVSIVSWDGAPSTAKPISLGLQEKPLPEDPHSGHPDLTFGWNAYSGSGDVTAEVVYVHRGTREDFARLADLGVDVRGKIVIARYGGNYRGYKVKFAEEAGAVGILIYTDPEDSGYRVGLPYPEGGFANESYIQRGSIKTLPYQGDPLTPFVPAVPGAKRLDPDEVALPRIPSQPLGWGAAGEVLSRMRGAPAPRDWHGALPFTYRLEGGPRLRVRLKVVQERKLVPTANVLASIEGAVEPEKKVILGCHFDAWSLGAGDPNAGSIVLYEVARSFALAARMGLRPARTLVFANWAAEEHGIIGSTEYCEAHAEDLRENGVAYINLDMAAMGHRVRSAAAPLLKTVFAEAAAVVPHPGGDPGRTLLESWSRGRPEGPRFGSLGGGSDHVGFYCHLGIPSGSLGAGGSAGVSYHSNYETLTWYRKVVGDDYSAAVLVTRLVNIAAARLAGATLLPFDPVRLAEDTRAHVLSLQRRAGDLAVPWPADEDRRLHDHLGRLEATTREFLHRTQSALAEDALPPARVREINEALVRIERFWIDRNGLPGRPWYRNLYASTDPYSGYAAWMLPEVRHHVERRDPPGVRAALNRVKAVVSKVEEHLRATLTRSVPPAGRKSSAGGSSGGG